MAVEIQEKPKVEEFQVVSIPEIKISKGAEKVLRTAYGKIRQPGGWIKRGWHRSYFRPNGKIVNQHCVLGAMGYDAYGDITFATGPQKEAACLYARVAGVKRVQSIVGWNDDSKRLKRHVLAVFQELLK